MKIWNLGLLELLLIEKKEKILQVILGMKMALKGVFFFFFFFFFFFLLCVCVCVVAGRGEGGGEVDG